MIDLHLHTTASDGRTPPLDLVAEVQARGITTFAVTDHDTAAAAAIVAAAALAAGLRTLPGIEVTAVSKGRDVHILGYFFDVSHPALATFLDRQREDRRRRLTEMSALLGKLGVPVDIEGALATRADRGKSLGRPILARALVEAGHVSSSNEAFDKYLSAGRPAFVERCGASPEQVVELLAGAGGLSSLAHPGKLRRDTLIPGLVDAGLTAIEIYHSDHDESDVNRYRSLAGRYGLLVSGGSDYHGRGSGRTDGFGRVQLPPEDFARLAERAGWPHA